MLNEIYQSLDPVAFAIGPFQVRWYGLAYIFGIVLAGFIMHRVAKRWKIDIDVDSLLTMLISALVGIVAGGRLGYVLFYGDGYFLEHPNHILAFNMGGMSFHGAIVGLAVAAAVGARLTKIPMFTWADLMVIGGSIGLFFGRLANFVNGELWGAPTDLPWGVVFGGAAGEIARHPSQLYEACLEGLVCFVILYLLSRRWPVFPRGFFTGVFFVVYAVARIAVEFVREPDVQLGYLFGGWLTMGMVLSFVLLLVGVFLVAHALVRNMPQQGRMVSEPEVDCAVDETEDSVRSAK